MKILAIEPHADDLFISVGYHLREAVGAGHQVTALTVYGDEKRQKETKAWSASIGIQHHYCLGLEEHGMDTPITHDPVLTLPERYDQWWGPLGLRHQEHLAVRRAVDLGMRLTQITPYLTTVLYYVDMPYAVKQKHKDMLNAAILNRRVVSVIAPTAVKYKDAQRVFKSQSMFFFNEKTNLERSWEMLVR